MVPHLQAGKEDLGLSEESIMDLMVPTLCSDTVISLRQCKVSLAVFNHVTPLFIGMIHLKVQNSIKSRATVCSATVFQDQSASTSVCLEKCKYPLV